MSEVSTKFDFTVITPCYNSGRYIEETIYSVLNNSLIISGRASLEYIIQDGGSSDDTLAIINKIIDGVKSDNIHFSLESGGDAGMYDALSRALRKASGRICSYVNAGDYYSPYALEIVAELFSTKAVKWLTGIKVLYNEKSQIIHASLPYKYRRSLIRKGAYGKLLPLLQQESTFWDGSLNSCLDLNHLSSLKLAGDYYLWREFSRHEELKIVEAWLGGFKFHQGQMSEARAEYLDELKRLADKLNPLDLAKCLIDILMWNTPTQMKKKCNKAGLYVYDHQRNSFR